MASKPSRVLTCGRRFCTKMIKSSSASCLFFFSFSFWSPFLDRPEKSLKIISVKFSCGHVWPTSGVFYWTQRLIIVSTSWNFVCVSNGRLKQGHVESCPPTTENNIIPLSYCLWPGNLAGWWLLMRGSEPKNPMILCLCGFARSRGKLKSL